jgi:subfamily B ATP-binding cassette protein MsbA
MTEQDGPKRPKLSLFETIRAVGGPYRRVYRYVKPYQWRFVLGILLGLGFGGLTSLLPLIFAQVCSIIFHNAVPNPKALVTNRQMLTTGSGQVTSIAWICLVIPLVMTARGLLSYGNTYFMNWVSNRVVLDIRNELFGKMIRHSMDFFNKTRSGFLMSRIANDTRSMQMALSTVSSDVFKQPITIVGAIAGLLYMDWKFTVVTLVLFPTCLIPIRLFARRARHAVQHDQKGMVQMTVTMQETFAGIRVIKSFGREEHQEKFFRRATQQQFANQMKMIKATEATGPLVEVIASIGVGLAFAYVYIANLPAGTFLGLLAGIFILYEPVKTLSKLHIVVQRWIGATNKIFALLDSAPTIQDRPDAVDIPASQGRIQFEHVTFRYPTASTDALRDFHLQIEPGKTYALVGPSGAGKSTILSLLLRLYDPTSGVIRIDGHDLRSVRQQSLRQQIGLVTQETFLFHESIFKNIQFGRLGATPEEVYAAARAAFAHDFIMAQPNGYETVIGDKGCLVSGGQQQRLAIARALLKDAPILLLDEATSALDSESEKHIQAALEHLSAGRTVIAIAHRLSTILSADQIIVMDHGRIVELGTHAELLDKSGYYRRLYDLQFNRTTSDGAEITREPDVLEEELAL